MELHKYIYLLTVGFGVVVLFYFLIEHLIKSSGKKNDIFRAVFAAPLAVIPALFIYSFYAAFVETRFPAYKGPRVFVVWEVFSDTVVQLVVAAYLTMFILGVPVILVLRSMKILNPATLIITGLIGAYINAYLFYTNLWGGVSPPSASELLLSSYFSTAICVVFWLVYRQGKKCK